MPFYKALLSIALSLLSLLLAGQTQVGVSNGTIQITPSYTVNNGTIFTVNGSIKNTGTTIITNQVHVHLAIDTSTTSTPKYQIRSTHTYSVTNFLPSQTFTFDVSDGADNANGYKVNGNGTTVVVWGVAGFPTNDSTTLDSVKTSLYVLPLPQSIDNLETINKLLNAMPNPITENITFTNTENYTIELIDTNGKVREILNDKLEILNDTNGLYIVRFRDKQRNEVSKKIIIQN